MVRYRCICASADNTCTESPPSSSSSSSSSASSASDAPFGTVSSALAVSASSASMPSPPLVLCAVSGDGGIEDECAKEQEQEEQEEEDGSEEEEEEYREEEKEEEEEYREEEEEEEVWLSPVSQLSLELPNSMLPTTARASATALTVAGADDAGRMDSCRRKSSGITKNSPQQSAQNTYRHMRQ